MAIPKLKKIMIGTTDVSDYVMDFKINKEYNELSALNELFKQKSKISNYYEESIRKYWLDKAKDKTNTRLISQKIGEIQEDKAIQEQQKEFIKHLNSLNGDLAQKVIIRKTRTT